MIPHDRGYRDSKQARAGRSSWIVANSWSTWGRTSAHRLPCTPTTRKPRETTASAADPDLVSKDVFDVRLETENVVSWGEECAGGAWSDVLVALDVSSDGRAIEVE